MGSVALPRPTIWHIPGGENPRLRATFPNDDDLEKIRFEKATSADSTEWATVGSEVDKPDPIEDPYVEAIDTEVTALTDTVYYRAVLVATGGAYTSAPSNVVQCDQNTFFFELRSGEELLRGVYFQADTNNADQGITWFSAMEQAERCHRKTIELLMEKFSTADIADVLADPPSDVVEIAKLMTFQEILLRVAMDGDERKDLLEITKEAYQTARADFIRGGKVVLSNGAVKSFKVGRLGVG